MFLEKAKVQNFRGIRSLAVDFEENSTFLIGENQWGKTSFLKALWMVLGKGTPCKFEKVVSDDTGKKLPPICIRLGALGGISNTVATVFLPFMPVLHPLQGFQT